MCFLRAQYIKSGEKYDFKFHEENPSLMLRKCFCVNDIPEKAEAVISALGIGYVYINGKRVSDDLFAAPCSDYNKTLWCVKYDVTELIKKGENCIYAICGNGFYNEDMPNAWESEKAAWRDVPKLCMEILFDGQPAVYTDDSWKCSTDTPYAANRLRCGVIYDSRRENSKFKDADFDDSLWDSAVKDNNPPKGKFRMCGCEGIREFERYKPVSVTERKDAVLFDFGLNMSGYLRIRVKQKPGDKIVFKYAEQIKEDGTLEYNGMQKVFYEGGFQTEVFICSGEYEQWSDIFSYHGFRYVEAKGLDMSQNPVIEAVFVHQAVERRASFKCSDDFLNKLYDCGIRATYSNLFYMPTDCPTREKYGWMNDAQSSAEQIMMNFKAEKLLEKWNRDICDAMNDKGELPGIVPTHGWGFKWGNGPVSDGSLFEQAYRIYIHTGSSKCLEQNLPYFKRYLKMLESKRNKDGFVKFGLHDWANPLKNEAVLTPTEFINAVYTVKFCKIAALAARLSGESAEWFDNEAEKQKHLICAKYIGSDGRCTVNEQTAVSMLIYHDICTGDAIKNQLKECVEAKDFHHFCGMAGLRHLYAALNKCGLFDYAFKIVTASGYPSYRNWIEHGATTLWEMWDLSESKNHHMYSDVLSWMVKTIGGISPDDNKPVFNEIEISPYFFEQLSFAEASYDSQKGRVEVRWERHGNSVHLKIIAPENNYVKYNGAFLDKGENLFVIGSVS